MVLSLKQSTVFFDITNVLAFFSYEKMLHSIAALYDTNPKKIHSFILQTSLQKKMEIQAIPIESFHQQFSIAFDKKVSQKHLNYALNVAFIPNEPILPLLEKLKHKGHRLIVLSNICSLHFQHLLQNFSFLQLFDEYILSYKLSVRKPDPKIFKYALEKTTQRHLFIDDREENIHAANKEGLNSHLFVDATQLIQKLQAENFL